MLFATRAGTSATTNGTDRQSPAPGVGTKATPGASIPATLRRTSSASVFPLSATRQMPIVTSTPTNTECTGV